MGKFKITSILVLITSFLFLSSCSTVNVNKINEAETAAVPLLGVNKYIDMTDVQQGAGTAIQRILDDDSFDLTPALKQLNTRVHEDYDKRLPVNIMEPEEVIETEKYQNFQVFESETSEENFRSVNNFNMITPEGYKPYHAEFLDDEMRMKMFESVPEEADAIMFAYASYDLIEDTSFLNWLIPFMPEEAVVEATITLEMIDREGNTLLDVSETAASEDRVSMVGGITLEPSKIQRLCINSTTKAFKALDKYTKQELAAAK